MINKACYYYEYNKKHFCILQNSEIQDCNNPCQGYELVCASAIFLNQMDKLHKNAMKIKQEPGFEDIVMHSTALYFVNRNADGKEINISPEEFAETIKIKYKNRIPNIRLIACNAGALEGGAAQKLANALNVKVKAPIGPVVVDWNGKMYVENALTGETIDQKDAWRIFEPRKEK